MLLADWRMLCSGTPIEVVFYEQINDDDDDDVTSEHDCANLNWCCALMWVYLFYSYCAFDSNIINLVQHLLLAFI